MILAPLSTQTALVMELSKLRHDQITRNGMLQHLADVIQVPLPWFRDRCYDCAAASYGFDLHKRYPLGTDSHPAYLNGYLTVAFYLSHQKETVSLVCERRPPRSSRSNLREH
jgi:hypothetical protein